MRVEGRHGLLPLSLLLFLHLFLINMAYHLFKFLNSTFFLMFILRNRLEATCIICSTDCILTLILEKLK